MSRKPGLETRLDVKTSMGEIPRRRAIVTDKHLQSDSLARNPSSF